MKGVGGEDDEEAIQKRKNNQHIEKKQFQLFSYTSI
jgi:hypothetical protein